MVELSRAQAEGGERWQVGHGGDTLNTAIHLARAGHDVAYLTALGDDPFSEQLKAAWAAEGLDTSLVLTHPKRRPGLYAIVTDAAGERSFVYWRETSAAREMFDLPSAAEAIRRASEADLLFFSLITLAILPAHARERLLAVARAVNERGGRVAFDGNYRPALWTSREEARAAHDAAIAVARIGLPTLDDETALTGAVHAATVAGEWAALGCGETLVKLGPGGCLLPSGEVIAPERVLAPVDTSGAGDAFNAGYLGARLDGADPAEAARAGHALAGWTIMRRGAIPPRDAERDEADRAIPPDRSSP